MKLLVVTDIYGWAWDIASKELLKSLPPGYTGTILSIRDFISQKPNVDSFDVVMSYAILDIRVANLLNPKNTIICVAGWDELDSGSIWSSLQRFIYFGACNEDIANHIKTKVRHRTVWVLSHGVDTDLFKPAEAKPARFTVGWAGNPRKIKRFPLAQEAVNKVGGVEFKMAGLIGTEKYIDHGRMPEWYRGLSCFLVTSTSEAHSLVVYEAMASGLPVISTRTGDTGENIIDGINGFLLHPNCSVDQIVPILTKLRDDPALGERVGGAARQTVLDKWTWDKVVKSYINAFDEVIKRRNSYDA